jgi:hypothetical protein
MLANQLIFRIISELYHMHFYFEKIKRVNAVKDKKEGLFKKYEKGGSDHFEKT